MTDAKRKRLIEKALDEATRGCNCGMGVAECDRCREAVLVEALEEALAKLAALVKTVDSAVDNVDHRLSRCSIYNENNPVCDCGVGEIRAVLAAAKVQP